jgi:hypothetical protein
MLASFVRPVESVCESGLHESPGRPNGRIVGNNYFVTALRAISFSRDIPVVFQPTPEEFSFLFLIDGLEIRKRHLVSVNNELSGANRTYKTRIFFIRKVEISWKAVRTKTFMIARDMYAPSWSLAAVLPNNGYSPVRYIVCIGRIIHVVPVSFCRKYIRPKFSVGHISSVGEGIFGGSVSAVSSPSRETSSDKGHNRSQCLDETTFRLAKCQRQVPFGYVRGAGLLDEALLLNAMLFGGVSASLENRVGCMVTVGRHETSVSIPLFD